MKEYHTKTIIHASKSTVWKHLTNFEAYKNWNPLVANITGNVVEGGTIHTEIVPLEETFAAKLLSFKNNQEMVWQGKRIAKFLLAGKHYYRLKSDENGHTVLEHGEYFTGVLSHFIAKKLLQKMENTFIQHNEALKNRIENEG